jgi:hypothetical protein
MLPLYNCMPFNLQAVTTHPMLTRPEQGINVAQPAYYSGKDA